MFHHHVFLASACFYFLIRQLAFTSCALCSPCLLFLVLGGRDLKIRSSVAPLIVGGRDLEIRPSASRIVEGDVLAYVCMALCHHMLKGMSSSHDDNLQCVWHRSRNNNVEPCSRLLMVWNKRQRTNGYHVWWSLSASLSPPRLCVWKWIRKKRMEYLLFSKIIYFTKCFGLSSRMTITLKLN